MGFYSFAAQRVSFAMLQFSRFTSGLAMFTTLSIGCASHRLPAGASSAFTSTDADIVTARQLYDAGQFIHATDLLVRSSADADARADLVEIMRRRRQEYTLDQGQMLEKIKKDIPDVTTADL